MTRARAIQILRDVWGTPTVISAEYVRELEAAANADETASGNLLATATRIALGRPVTILAGDHRTVRELCARAEIDLARSGGVS